MLSRQGLNWEKWAGRLVPMQGKIETTVNAIDLCIKEFGDFDGCIMSQVAAVEKWVTDLCMNYRWMAGIKRLN
jgi:hypothetical protein